MDFSSTSSIRSISYKCDCTCGAYVSLLLSIFLISILCRYPPLKNLYPTCSIVLIQDPSSNTHPISFYIL